MFLLLNKLITCVLISVIMNLLNVKLNPFFNLLFLQINKRQLCKVFIIFVVFNEIFTRVAG